MAKFVNSIYSPNKSGRLGASVFGKSKSGPWEKMLGIPSNTMTDEQVNRHSQFAALSRHWSNLTDAQRKGWTDLAKYFPLTKKGISYVLSGFMFFMMLNSNLQVIGEPITEESPDIVAPETFTEFSVEAVATPGTEDLKVNLSPAIDTNSIVQLSATTILRPGRKGYEKDLYHIGNLDHTFVSGGSIKDMYIAKFGKLPGIGKKALFQVKATNISDGYTAIPLAYTAIGTV